jgi:hypothetical protein
VRDFGSEVAVRFFVRPGERGRSVEDEGRVERIMVPVPADCNDPDAGRRYSQLASGLEPGTTEERCQVLEHVSRCAACRRVSVFAWFEQNVESVASRLPKGASASNRAASA